MVFKFLTARNQHKASSYFAAYFILTSFLAYFSTLKTEATCSSEKLDDFERTTQRYIPQVMNLLNYSKISLIRACRVELEQSLNNGTLCEYFQVVVS
jgi:hypothetical protein